MNRSELTRKYLSNLGYPYDNDCIRRIVSMWEEDHAEQLVNESGFEIDEEDVSVYWFSYVNSKLFSEKKETRIIISKGSEEPKESKWSYPLSEIPYLLEQIEDGDRENGYEFFLYKDRLYEKDETKEW